MAQVIADVTTRDPATVERQESTLEEESGSALADVSAADGNP
jgi:hypothetical protein